jgi:hypothetical protein
MLAWQNTTVGLAKHHCLPRDSGKTKKKNAFTLNSNDLSHCHFEWLKHLYF